MKKPYIARDTKQPLIVLGGCPIAEDGLVIRQKAQGGRPLATENDYQLLQEHGWDGLKEKQMFGVLDRLNNPDNPKT